MPGTEEDWKIKEVSKHEVGSGPFLILMKEIEWDTVLKLRWVMPPD
jgi:hypothetical protein